MMGTRPGGRTLSNEADLLIDLALAKAGGRILEASDERLGPATRLLERDGARPRDRKERRYDGWATRRRRDTGHDWVILRLGIPGIPRVVRLDTTHITGDAPAAFSLEAAYMTGDPSMVDLVRSRDKWVEIVPRSTVRPDEAAAVPVVKEIPATHVRLIIYPDGGVARFRCLGDPLPPVDLIGKAGVDLAAISSGARVVACSDRHFQSPNRMLLDGDGRYPGDGWETRRRREPGHEWAIIRLAGRGTLERIVIDLRGFGGTTAAGYSIEGIDAPGVHPDDIVIGEWPAVLPETALAEDRRHEITDLEAAGPFTHLRLGLHPDGGVTRFRALGTAERPWIGID